MIVVRAYSPEDAAAFLRLYDACQAHYEAPRATEDTKALILDELAAQHGLRADIAWADDRPVGFTCSMRVFPAGNGFAIYLKELFVTADARGTGAGRALMRNLAERAVAMRATSLRWESKEIEALKFYARLGAPDNGKTSFTVWAPDLPGFAA
ncbi:MAG: GNAT family N-acetyltransferase [Pseudomonadota bacterium]